MRILAGATTALRRIVDLGLVVLVLVVLFGVLLGKGAPLAGRQSIVIGGGSMEPAIGLGAAILIRPVEAAELAVGDVVSMQIGPERATYTHRIVAVVDRPDGRWIRTKGDANADPDPTLVPATAVIGRVEFVIPWAGYLLALLSLPVGVLFVLGLAATLLAIAWLLESLEVDARPARRFATGSRPDPGPTDPVLPAAPALPATPAGEGAAAAALVDPELLRGEPIAARPARFPLIAGAAPALSAVGPVAGHAAGSAALHAGPARPTVREQIARSREVRNQRARWQIGRGRARGRGAAD